MESGSETRQLKVEPGEAGLRLDVFLAQRLEGWSRSRLQAFIRSGCVQVDSQTVHKAHEEVAGGGCITVRLETEPLGVVPENVPLAIVYEDEDLAVINKPAGMIVHPGAGITSGTLVNALVHRFDTLSSGAGAHRPGIVHRLDKNTSGLILVAKNDAAHLALAACFKARAIHKTYIALVHGRVARDTGEIDTPVGRDLTHRRRMKAGAAAAREARTRYRVVRRFSAFTLLEVFPETGRTHQIRVHLASIGHPVAGDALYGAPRRQAGAEQKIPARTFLHASALEFQHPRTGETMRLTAPLPEELKNFLDSIPDEQR